MKTYLIAAYHPYKHHNDYWKMNNKSAVPSSAANSNSKSSDLQQYKISFGAPKGKIPKTFYWQFNAKFYSIAYDMPKLPTKKSEVRAWLQTFRFHKNGRRWLSDKNIRDLEVLAKDDIKKAKVINWVANFRNKGKRVFDGTDVVMLSRSINTDADFRTINQFSDFIAKFKKSVPKDDLEYYHTNNWISEFINSVDRTNRKSVAKLIENNEGDIVSITAKARASKGKKSIRRKPDGTKTFTRKY